MILYIVSNLKKKFAVFFYYIILYSALRYIFLFLNLKFLNLIFNVINITFHRR